MRGDKDGGTESRVWCWGIEFKKLGSVLLLKFGEGSREAYHTHAFNSLSWVLRGGLHEFHKGGQPEGANYSVFVSHVPSVRPIVTRRDTFHMVEGCLAATWVFTLRGPWVDEWREFLPKLGRFVRLTHGRKEVK